MNSRNSYIYKKCKYLFLLLVVLSCSREGDFLHKNMYGPLGKEKIKYFVDEDGWSIILRTEEEEEIFFSLEKNQNDTLKRLTLFRSKFDKKIRVEAYTKSFMSEGAKSTISFKLDTFYHFLELEDLSKEFIIGEYNYRFENALLNPEELDYYTLFEDSLGRVKGNNLPHLPQLSTSERNEFNRKYNK